jgi:hypothetical protein
MLSFALIINPQAFAAGKTLYDDFSSNYIDGSKWRQRNGLTKARFCSVSLKGVTILALIFTEKL